MERKSTSYTMDGYPRLAQRLSLAQVSSYLACMFILLALHTADAKAVFPRDAVAVKRLVFTGADTYPATDTLLAKAELDAQLMDEHITVTDEQRQKILRMLVHIRQFLEIPHTSVERKKLTLNAHRRRLEKTLTKPQYQKLEETGVLAAWFERY